MARTPRHAILETRTQRARITDTNRHWQGIGKGLAIGYRRGATAGTWYVRQLLPDGKYSYESIAAADDVREADGVSVLDYFQACEHARQKAGQAVQKVKNYTVDAAAADYLEWAKAHTKSAADTELTVKAHILPTFKGRTLASLRTAEIDRWKHAIVTSPLRRRGKLVETGNDPETIRKRRATANRVLTVFKALLNRAFEHGKVQDNAEWRRVRPFENVEDARKVFLQPAECKRLINAAQGAFRAYVQALLYTGARPGKELEFLRVCDFDADAGTVRIPDGKTGARDVFLSDEGVKFFTRLTAGRAPDDLMLIKNDGSPWLKSHHIRPMQQAVAAAKLPRETNAYALRHTYISMALKAGVNVKVLADSCGTSLRMIEKHYAKFLHADRRAMFAGLPSLGLKRRSNVRAIR